MSDRVAKADAFLSSLPSTTLRFVLRANGFRELSTAVHLGNTEMAAVLWKWTEQAGLAAEASDKMVADLFANGVSGTVEEVRMFRWISERGMDPVREYYGISTEMAEDIRQLLDAVDGKR